MVPQLSLLVFSDGVVTMEYVSLEVPRFFKVVANDYHEFSSMAKHLRECLCIDYNYEEIDTDRVYLAVFWVGSRPEEFIESLKG